MSVLRLAAEGDTADRESVVRGVAEARGGDSVRIEVQGVGAAANVANRGPVAADVACVAWIDVATPDKHQRRLYNSIRIS